MDEVTSYSTTDLCLYSAEDLTSLAAVLEARGLHVLHRALLITFAIKDGAGNPIGDFTLNLTGGGSSGTYFATFTGVSAGSATTLKIEVNGVSLGSPPTEQVIPGPVDARNSN